MNYSCFFFTFFLSIVTNAYMPNMSAIIRPNNAQITIYKNVKKSFDVITKNLLVLQDWLVH